jgi:hypothetical protein
MNVMKEKTIESFLDELASKHATPGGGSAAALIGAQAAALVSMVCNLTLGKPKYAAVQDEMNAILTEAEDLRTQLTTMIKDDIEVFDRLMDSYISSFSLCKSLRKSHQTQPYSCRKRVSGRNQRCRCRHHGRIQCPKRRCLECAYQYLRIT